MQTLSKGFKKPETPDEGAIVFPALEDNWQLVNDHTHNGTNSAKINSAYVEKTSLDLEIADWVLGANGHYYQNKTLPLGLQYDAVVLTFKLTTGEQVYPTVSKVSATQFRADFDDNSLVVTCVIT